MYRKHKKSPVVLDKNKSKLKLQKVPGRQFKLFKWKQEEKTTYMEENPLGRASSERESVQVSGDIHISDRLKAETEQDLRRILGQSDQGDVSEPHTSSRSDNNSLALHSAPVPKTKRPRLAPILTMRGSKSSATVTRGHCGQSGSCFKCGEEGHMSRECPQGGGGGGGGGSRACFKCGEEGHMSRECPHGGGGGGGGDKGCFKCKEEGHMARDCPNAESSDAGYSGPIHPPSNPPSMEFPVLPSTTNCGEACCQHDNHFQLNIMPELDIETLGDASALLDYTNRVREAQINRRRQEELHQTCCFSDLSQDNQEPRPRSSVSSGSRSHQYMEVDMLPYSGKVAHSSHLDSHSRLQQDPWGVPGYDYRDNYGSHYGGLGPGYACSDYGTYPGPQGRGLYDTGRYGSQNIYGGPGYSDYGIYGTYGRPPPPRSDYTPLPPPPEFLVDHAPQGDFPPRNDYMPASDLSRPGTGMSSRLSTNI